MTQTRGIKQDVQSGRWRIVCRDGSYYYFYRAVMEAHLGRTLEPWEQVHHINGDPSDDRLENLELLDIRSHGGLHGREGWLQRKATWQHEWSEAHAECRDCGTTERPHQAHGLCVRCDAKHRARGYRAAKRGAA